MKLNWKKLLLYIFIPLLLGAIVGFLSGSFKGFDQIVVPDFAPPKIAFPIVWSILYILMGTSRYLVEKDKTGKAVKIYNIQLTINLLWSFFFFLLKWYLFSFLWIVLLMIAVIWMIRVFYPISKTAALIQIPYLLWITFAAILNFAIYLLN